MSAVPDDHILQIVPQIPAPPAEVQQYVRFGPHFEPFEWTNWIDESMSWKETCYIGDWSPLFKVNVQGPEALRFFASIAGNDFERFDVGQAKHLALCNEQGHVMGDGILMRRGEDDFLFTSGPGAMYVQWQFAQGRWDATIEDVSGAGFIFQVQGPASLELLEEVTGESLRDIGFMRFADRTIDGRTFTVLRQGMAGEIGYELHGRTEDGIAIWTRIWEAGQRVGIRRLGGRTKMVNHVEACFPTPAVDYIPAWFDPDVRQLGEFMVQQMPMLERLFFDHTGSFETDDLSDLYFTPVELGWAHTLAFRHDFIGREALEREAADPKRKIVTLVWNDDDVVDVYASLFRSGEPAYQYMELPREGLGCVWADRVEVDGELVGVTMSRCYSYFFREMISLCVIDVAHAEPGTAVELIWGAPGHRQKRIRATVAPAPYKTDKRKLDVTRLGAAAAA